MTVTKAREANPTAATSTVHVLGVRHHGPGSARSVERALETIQPDVVLVEGPPDADALLPLGAHPDMIPPVALLIYRPDEPQTSVYYPFAVFSPEWRAFAFASARGIPIRFMDLPVAIQFGIVDEETTKPEESEDGEPPIGQDAVRRIRTDPLQVLAEAAGYDDGERWWEHVVEHRFDGVDLFEGIAEAMAAVREGLPPTHDLREQQREAHMRQTIRAAQAEGGQRIAVVCGAWHAPVLMPQHWPKAKDDAAVLKGLPKVKVAATWVPWTHGRLASESGYGAGMQSPGWYHHLWTARNQVVNRWMTRVARLLREAGIEASSASVIESVRLAEALAALRGRPLPGLLEIEEAIRSVLCNGDDTPMQLIRRKLIVGETLGHVPDETPTVPLQQDVARLQKALKLPPDPAQKPKVLDLREPTDLERSRLLHRLGLLGVAWGQLTEVSGKGTFKEGWQLQWQPEFPVALIEASRWGVTVRDAASARVRDRAENAPKLAALTELLDQALHADLPEAVSHVMARLQSQAAVAADVTDLMHALPPLAKLVRYSDVRKTDTSLVEHVVAGFCARICIGLPPACGSLADDAAAAMYEAILATDSAIRLIQNETHLADWHATIRKLADAENLHQLVSGRCCRIMLDARAFEPDEVARRMGLAVSTATEPSKAAAWVEGFLKGSGELLYHDDALFGIVDGWLASLSAETFQETLPLLRRTFSTFHGPLRRNLGEKAKGFDVAALPGAAPGPSADFDAARAALALPLLKLLLGSAGDGDIRP